MNTVGRLIRNHVFVEKQKDIDRLHNKSRFGQVTLDGKLRLTLVEACYLKSKNKIKIYTGKKKTVGFEHLLKTALEKTPDFLVNYLVFKDLRERGYTAEFRKGDKSFNFCFPKKDKGEKTCYIKIFYEEEKISFKKIKKFIEKADGKKGELWLAVVDEEEDITYYEVKKIRLHAQREKKKFKKTEAVFLDKRALILDEKNSEELHETEFYGKPFDKGLQISTLETIYLKKREILDLKKPSDKKRVSVEKIERNLEKTDKDYFDRYLVFCDLKNNGLIVKTGFKYGADFRAYEGSPDKTHAEYLVVVVHMEKEHQWNEISRSLRLAHSVNKKMIYAVLDVKQIRYVYVKRVRP